MAGHLGCLQAKVKEKFNHAIFVHCIAHRLNLVLSRSMDNIKDCKVFFSTLSGLASFFSKSSKITRAILQQMNSRFQNFNELKFVELCNFNITLKYQLSVVYETTEISNEKTSINVLNFLITTGLNKSLCEVVKFCELVLAIPVTSQEYVNYKGNVVPAKSVGDLCNCKLKCLEKITNEQQLEAFERFYNLATKDEQDLYLQGLVHVSSIKTRRPRVQQLNDLGRTTNQLLQAGVTPTDKRGKQVSANVIPAEEKIRIHEHINSFPVKTSHYSSREYHYLSSELTVKTMYSMFKEKYPDSKIKYEYYNRIFKDDFDLKFDRQQVDTCCTCENLSIKIKSKDLNENAKRVALAEMLVHKRRSKKFYTALQESTKKSKESNNVVALAFDYMQNLQLPKIPVQDLFYLRQLTVSVFCIHNMKTDQVVYFIYHEGCGKKGPNEVCFFLYQYIKEYIPDSVRELHLFSDNCPGQNKNNTLIRMCLFLKDSGRFDDIQQYFPIRGHSFLPCDRDFGNIKRKLKKVDRVYTIRQYIEIIASFSNKHKFLIHLVDGKDIVNFKDWWPGLLFCYLTGKLPIKSDKMDPHKEIG
ncbi:unnamed protein product [Psylliodes chrysocephalus]|uniref:DUF7869 domain-containing protein n=1 Tax=Psylliodes chrysocephalus TaxID=3402493 RepID=A0A9P0G772_9CUCU|nr:unnamed protein product [Psylliodes chrysocephala]